MTKRDGIKFCQVCNVAKATKFVWNKKKTHRLWKCDACQNNKGGSFYAKKKQPPPLEDDDIPVVTLDEVKHLL